MKEIEPWLKETDVGGGEPWLRAEALLEQSELVAAGGLMGSPLLELGCKIDNTITGGNRADDRPAGAANGGPIGGLIPNTVGNASLVPETLGFGRAADSVCS